MSKPKLKISCDAQNNQAVIRIDGGIWDWSNSATAFKSQVDQLLASGIKNATVYINSDGGDVFEADEICNEICRFTDTIAHLGAKCMSAATSLACKCGKVIASANTSYMIHKPSMGMSGNCDEVKADLKLLENKTAEYAQMYADKTGLTVAKIEEMWIEDYWMNAEEAKQLGFVNEIEGCCEITPEDVEAITAYKNAPKITATAKTNTNNKNQISTEMKELIITMSGLPATATDVQLIAYMEGLRSKAAKADALQTQLTALQTSAIEEKSDVVLDACVTAKKITAAQKPFYKKNLIADFDGTKAMLDAMPALTALSGNIKAGTGGSTEDRSAWTYADYQHKNPKALAELAKDDEARFTTLFEAHYGKKLS